MARMKGAAVAAIVAAGLAGCDTVGLFRSYPTVEAEGVAAADWPRLVDVPPAPAKGAYSADVPDPAQGYALLTELGGLGGRAETRRTAAAAPVVSEDERARTAERRAVRAREARGGPLFTPEERARIRERRRRP